VSRPGAAARRDDRPDPLSALVTRAGAWLLEPVDPPARLAADRPPPEPPPPPTRPLVAVVALAPRAGASTVARALAARLASLDPAGVAVLCSDDVPARAALGGRAAVRLARTLAERGLGVRAAGSLCLLPSDAPLAGIAGTGEAPLAVDVSHGAPIEAVLTVVRHVVLVATPDVEPALANAVQRSLRAGDRAVDVVVNRAIDRAADGAIAGRGSGHAPRGSGKAPRGSGNTRPGSSDAPQMTLEAPGGAVVVPESRFAAHATLACRGPYGPLAAPIAELADRCLAQARI
jgi:hypothetical protein